jgi:rare lipoprotein A (peptidoglycan hydrolase)
MKPLVLVIATVLGSCAADAASTATSTMPAAATIIVRDPVASGADAGMTASASTDGSDATDSDDGGVPYDGSPIPARCNALASMQCGGRDCDASDAWTRRAIRRQRGRVSYYADMFQGRRTASGDRFDQRALTAASRTLPFGALVRIHRADHPEHVVLVRVNDRGPFGRGGRILDLSRRAAECIDMIRAGVVQVEAEVIDWGPRGAP